jgi:hypothetical protein
MLSGMAYDASCPELLTVPPPAEVRRLIAEKRAELNTLRKLLRVSEAVAEAQGMLSRHDEGRAD